MKNLIMLTILFLGLSASAQLQFRKMVYGGTGCPAGSLSELLAFENKGKIWLDLNLETHGQQSLITKKNCIIRIPVTLAEGYQLGIRMGGLLGFIAQDTKPRTTLTTRTGFLGVAKPHSFTKAWNSQSVENFKIEAFLLDYTWSDCSVRSTAINLDTTVTVSRPDLSQNVVASLSELNFEYAIRSCR